MKYFYLFLANALGSLLVSHPTQAQTLKIPNFARPTVTTPQINLPTSRPSITTPQVSTSTLRPQTSVSFPTNTTTISVPSFPNVNNLGDRLIQSPQIINFPQQKLPTNANGTTTQFFPASITPPNNLNSTLPLAVIVPQFPNFNPDTAPNSVVFLNALLNDPESPDPKPFPNATPISNQLQLVPTLITFPKQNPQISLPTLSNLTTTPLPTVTNNLSSVGGAQVGVGLRIVEPSPPPPAPQPITSKNSFSFTLPSGFENTGGTLFLD